MVYRAAAVIVAAVLISVGLSAQMPPGKKPTASKASTAKSGRRQLTIKQIEQLISIRTPDVVVAQEITARGVAETVTRQVVSWFQQKGAGPETAAALTRLIARATLALRTTSEAEVLVDGAPRGIAGHDGQLTLPDLDPGPHKIEIRQSNFHPHSSAIHLPPNQTTSLDAVLEWAVGFLTVTTNPSDAQIRVPGGVTAAGRVTRVAVPIGQAAVVASAPLRKTVTQMVTIEPGKEATISLSLPLDEAALQAMANQIHAAFRSQEYEVVLEQSARYFQTGARDRAVLADVALSYLERSGFAEFKKFAGEALAAGATLHIPLRHHHAGWNGSMHPAVLQLTAHTLRFQPEGRCNTEPFEGPLSQMHVGNRDTASVAVHRSLVSKERTVWAVNLVVPNPANPKKTTSINLVQGDGTSMGHANAIREFLQSLTR